ncbi:ABC-2 type transport system ATP-binding protein [Thermosulfuriphilus ammonigenes]|nr:ATP-binding cassette domain-containing protein [Thermosulfuriphilus ammonigenes]MBA2849502.1 ABC-2 type transport system ATP-binding protein [Thermosulfuriphilus ammonigenes]
MSHPAVVIRGLRKRYGRIEALGGLDLEIPKGEIFGLIGPDGAGKSSLLKIIAGVLSHDEGQVIVLSQPLASEEDAEAIKGRLGFMPQGLGLHLYPELTVEENLRFFAELRLVPEKEYYRRRERLLAITRLAPYPDRKVKDLSGGMKQKLGLACTLIHQPELIILDEPTTGVDPLSRQELWAIVAELVAERELTAVISTSYLDEASRFHQLALLSGGRIIARGTPEDLAPEGLESWFFRLAEKHHPVAYLPPVLKGEGEPPSGPVIEARELVKDFGRFRAVDRVSFSVAAGEVFGLLGPNGAGKTTVVRMLCGLLRPSRGEGRVAGVDMRAPGRHIRQRIGYMSQSFSLYRDLTARENLWLYAGIYGVRNEKEVMEALVDLCQLKGFEERRTADLPLGVRQRLALACAIVHRPQVVFLDEPTSGVDPPGRKRFWEIIYLLAQELKITVLVTTHYMTEAEYCDRLCLMHEGRIIAEGTPKALKEAVLKRAGRPISLLVSNPLSVLRELRGMGLQATLYGARIRVLAPEEKINALKAFSPRGLLPEEITMEDVFVYHILREEGHGMEKNQGLGS